MHQIIKTRIIYSNAINATHTRQHTAQNK